MFTLIIGKSVSTHAETQNKPDPSNAVGSSAWMYRGTIGLVLVLQPKEQTVCMVWVQ